MTKASADAVRAAAGRKNQPKKARLRRA